MATAEITSFPLHALYVHPLNTRSEPPSAEIEALAESIRQSGLLQNLMGFADRDATDPTRGIGIVAGGRRLRALQLLHGPDADILIPVRVTTDPATATEWAGTENAARAALNPADEIRAYARLRAAGHDPRAIAIAFAKSERHVLGRLRLAILPDAALDALRAGQISLDQAAALTVAENDAAILDLLPRITGGGWGTTPDNIRRMLQPESVSIEDRRAVFATVQRYLDAGGRISADFFADHQRLLDPAILDRVFDDALEEARADLATQGFAVTTLLRDQWFDYSLVSGLRRLERPQIDLPEADAARLEELAEIGNGDGLTDEEAAEYDALEARTVGDFDPDEKARATAFWFVDRHGSLIFAGAWELPMTGPADADAGDDDQVEVKVEKVPQSLIDDLRIIRTLTIQAALIDKPELVLDLLAASLDLPTYAAPLALGAINHPPAIAPSKLDGVTVPDRLAEAYTVTRAARNLIAEAIEATRAGGKTARNIAMTTRLARLFCAAHDDRVWALMLALTGANPRRLWTPTGPGYFSRLPGPALDRIWTRLAPDRAGNDHADFRAMKKADKAQHLHRLFGDADFREAMGLSRAEAQAIDSWLPPELRAPETSATADTPATSETATEEDAA